MNVLSLFDGMRCGRMALEQAGVTVTNYYASEVDKYAIRAANANYPAAHNLGDVTKWREWDIDWSSIDLLIGGSPCQGFSFSGDQLAFDDPRSKLFFVYEDILNHIKKFNKSVKFLLENVKMKKEYLDVISNRLGVKPTLINSALVSAQNRNRYYWYNFKSCEQPHDRGIELNDIIESLPVDKLKKYHLSEKAITYINQPERIKKKLTAINGDKSLCLMSQYDQSKNGTFLCVDANGRVDARKTGTITSRYYKGVENYGSNPFIYDGERFTFRKLTPRECMRLQTIPESNIEVLINCGVSNTQLYKMTGNGWTVEIIAHLLKPLSL